MKQQGNRERDDAVRIVEDCVFDIEDPHASRKRKARAKAALADWVTALGRMLNEGPAHPCNRSQARRRAAVADKSEGKKVGTCRPSEDAPAVRTIPLESLLDSDSVIRNGPILWAGYDNTGRLIALGATEDEARRKYRQRKREAAKILPNTR